MTKAELTEKIRKGSDILFAVASWHFTIIVDEKMKFSIDEQYPNGGREKQFETAQELVNTYRIDGVPLGDLSNEVVIEEYTLSGAE